MRTMEKINKKKYQVSANLSKDLYERMTVIENKTNISHSDMIRQALIREIAKLEVELKIENSN